MSFGRNRVGKTIHFLHISKTGGTAVVEALSPIAERFNIILHKHQTKLRDIPSTERVFFFVRDPIQRFVSGFWSRYRRGAPRYNYQWDEGEARAFSRFQSPNELAEALSSKDPQLAELACQAMRDIRHVSSKYDQWFSGKEELATRSQSILFIGLQETLQGDFESIKVIFGLPQSLTLPSDDVRAHRTPGDYDRTLTILAQENLTRWYMDDIHFYEECMAFRRKNALCRPGRKHSAFSRFISRTLRPLKRSPAP